MCSYQLLERCNNREIKKTELSHEITELVDFHFCSKTISQLKPDFDSRICFYCQVTTKNREVMQKVGYELVTLKIGGDVIVVIIP